MKGDKTSSAVKRANIKYHAAMAHSYDQDQPHFKPENVSRVSGILKSLSAKAGNEALLDIGCGTGFIIRVSEGIFKHVVGIDITEPMIRRAPRTALSDYALADMSLMPFRDGRFNLCTAYSLLHHLSDLPTVFGEVYRCLRKGGIFYADQEPNYHFFRFAKECDSVDQLPEGLRTEVLSVTALGAELERKYGLKSDVTELAEYHKYKEDGFTDEGIRSALEAVGFARVDISYEWYLRQGEILHTVSEASSQLIERYLRSMLPASRTLFKYIQIRARK